MEKKEKEEIKEVSHKPKGIIYEERNFKIALTTELLGAVPKNPQLIRDHVMSNLPADKKAIVDGELVPAVTIDEEPVNLDLLAEKSWTGFRSDEKGLFLFEYVIKGFLKSAGNTLKDQLGVKALRSKIDDNVFISPRKIYLNQMEPDGCIERPIRVMTMQGPRVALIKSDYIDAGKEIDFTLTILKHKEISWEILDLILAHGRWMGLGQFRNGGYGRFTRHGGAVAE